MSALSLRIRVLLFFCLLACGSAAFLAAGLYVGYRQAGETAGYSPFLTAGIIAGLGITGLIVAVWLLFDENVSKPIEALAAGVRVRAHSDVMAGIEAQPARYLGDLAPAVAALHKRLMLDTQAASEATPPRIARLEAERAQLLQILSDIPLAVIVARQDHQIVLYDGQAAELMECECPARLQGSVFDYLDRQTIAEALTALQGQQTPRQEITVTGRSGTIYKGHIRLFGKTAGYTLMLEPLSPDAARPLVYDFDLLDRAAPSDLAQTALRNLTFVVFDSETTGLDPKSDAVVQLGAVRVVNGRIVPGEVFDRLVNPGRPIPPGSTRVHGISDAMVAEAPAFSEVCAAFHSFAAGAVIIAHNAPFDMAFLRQETAGTDITFDNPVLDTVHLSAVVFGGAAEHTLDALCDRLDIQIPDTLRHTAMGDALATAQAFTALLPILEARGLNSFQAVRKEVQKHKRILTPDA